MSRMQPGHQRTPRRGTHRAARIMLGELHTGLGNPVDIGRLEFLLTITTQVAVSEIVSQDVDNIRAGEYSSIPVRADGIMHSQQTGKGRILQET